MASEATCSLGTKIINLINKDANEHNLSCGDIVELMAILNCSVADWISGSMKAEPAELLASFYTSSIECHKLVNKEDEDEH